MTEAKQKEGTTKLPEVATVNEVAAFARVSTKMVYEARKRGELRCGSIRKPLRFYRQDVMNWLRGNASV